MVTKMLAEANVGNITLARSVGIITTRITEVMTVAKELTAKVH
jgi:hypothetical protein